MRLAYSCLRHPNLWLPFGRWENNLLPSSNFFAITGRPFLYTLPALPTNLDILIFEFCGYTKYPSYVVPVDCLTAKVTFDVWAQMNTATLEILIKAKFLATIYFYCFNSFIACFCKNNTPSSRRKIFGIYVPKPPSTTRLVFTLCDTTNISLFFIQMCSAPSIEFVNGIKTSLSKLWHELKKFGIVWAN